MDPSRNEQNGTNLGPLIIVYGLPTVDQTSRTNLNTFLLRQFGEVNPNDHTRIIMPLDQHGLSIGYILSV